MLETKIEKLTEAIQQLTAVIIEDVKADLRPLTDTVEEVVQEVKQTEQPTPEPTPTAPTITHDDVKSLCLRVSQEVAGGKIKAKALLEKHGAKKVIDLPESELSTISDELTSYLDA